MKTDKKVEVDFHPQVNHQVVVKNVRTWQQDHLKSLVSHVRGPNSKMRYEACKAGLLASMDDAFNKIPVRARA